MTVRAQVAGELGRLLRVRALGQLAQNALLYALLIAVVEHTDSSFYTGLLVAVLTLPSIVLGVLGGTLADLLPIRGVLVVGSWLRAGIVALMAVNRDDLGALYWLAFLFMVVNQVTGPAESAALPRLTAAEGLPRATSLFVLAGMVGQAGGAMLLAPLLLKALGPGSVMVLTVVLLMLTSYLAARLSPMPRAEAARHEALGPRLLGAVALGWRIVSSQRPAFLAMAYLTLAMALMKGVAVLAPYYVKDTLGITSENTVYIMAPAAIGAGLALALTPFLARFIRLERLMAAALLSLLASLLGLGLVVQLKGVILSHLDLGISFVEERLGVSSVITLTLLLAVPAGAAATAVLVAARTVLHRSAPLGAQARVFATQAALADAFSLPPTLVMGSMADLVGPRSVLLGATLVAAWAAYYVSRSRRFPQPALQPTS